MALFSGKSSNCSSAVVLWPDLLPVICHSLPTQTSPLSAFQIWFQDQILPCPVPSALPAYPLTKRVKISITRLKYWSFNVPGVKHPQTCVQVIIQCFCPSEQDFNALSVVEWSQQRVSCQLKYSIPQRSLLRWEPENSMLFFLGGLTPSKCIWATPAASHPHCSQHWEAQW